MRLPFFLLALAPFAAQGQPATDGRELLLRSGEPLLTAPMVRISGTGKLDVDISGSPRTIIDQRFTIAFSKDGRARWELSAAAGVPRLRVWDGTSSWDYFPASKTYSKGLAKTAPETEPIAFLKYGRTEANIVSARIEREEQLDFGGKPAPCYVVHADYSAVPNAPGARNTVRTVWIARDNNLVLRDIWDYELPFGNNVVKTRQTISYSAIEWSDLVAEDVFLFTPPEGSKAVRAFTPPPTTLNHPGLGVGGGIGSGRPDGLGRGAGTNGTSGTRPGVYHVGNGVTAPSVLSKTEPVYTEEVRAAKLQGDVLLYLEVDPSGKPTNIKVIRALGLGLDLKAIEAVGTWVFTPGTKDGKAVTVAAQIVVNFRLL